MSALLVGGGHLVDFEVTQHQVDWCDRLWTSLKIGASWTLPTVGVYQKTGHYQLTLTELFFSSPTPDAFGNDAFDNHDWVIYVAGLLNWSVETEIERAFDWSGEEITMWDSDRIGDVAVCSKNCGAVIRIEPYEAGNHYTQITRADIKTGVDEWDSIVEQGSCPCCDLPAFGKEWVGCWVVVDDKAARLKILNQITKESEEE